MFITAGCMTYIGICFFKDALGFGGFLAFLAASVISVLPFIFAYFKPMLTPIATVIHGIVIAGSIIANLHTFDGYTVLLIAVCVFHLVRTYIYYKRVQNTMR